MMQRVDLEEPASQGFRTRPVSRDSREDRLQLQGGEPRAIVVEGERRIVVGPLRTSVGERHLGEFHIRDGPIRRGASGPAVRFGSVVEASERAVRAPGQEVVLGVVRVESEQPPPVLQRTAVSSASIFEIAEPEERFPVPRLISQGTFEERPRLREPASEDELSRRCDEAVHLRNRGLGAVGRFERTVERERFRRRMPGESEPGKLDENFRVRTGGGRDPAVGRNDPLDRFQNAE